MRKNVYLDPNIRRVERFDHPTGHDIHVDTAMDNISIGYRNTEYIADQIFPQVKVNHQSDKYYIFDKSAWLRNEAAVRAPGTRAVRIGYTVTTGQYATIEYAAAKSVPDK